MIYYIQTMLVILSMTVLFVVERDLYHTKPDVQFDMKRLGVLVAIILTLLGVMITVQKFL